MVKNLPAVQETQVQSLGQEDPLVKEMDGNPLQCSHLENSVDKKKKILWTEFCIKFSLPSYNFNQQYFTFKALALFAVAVIAKLVGSKSCNSSCNGFFYNTVDILLYGAMGIRATDGTKQASVARMTSLVV